MKTKKQLLATAKKLEVNAFKSWTNEKIFNQIAIKRKSILSSITIDIDHHERWSRSYFWSSRGNASNRRQQERDNSYKREILFDGQIYSYESSVSVSCQNVYYTGSFQYNGEQKNLRLWRKLYDLVNAA